MDVVPKPSLKIRTASAICWNYLGLFRDYGLDHIFDRSLVEAVQGIALSQTFFVAFPQILEYFIIL